MMRRRRPAASHGRPARHGRHGRLGRSAVVRPPLPPLESRLDAFDLTVASTAEFLRGAWPELRDVRFEVAPMPGGPVRDRLPKWAVSTQEQRIVLYRVPIERLGLVPRNDPLYRRALVETAVVSAAAEYLDRDPWDLGPGRFR